jgi:hypothetical protein
MSTAEMILSGAAAVGWLVAIGLGIKVKRTSKGGARLR